MEKIRVLLVDDHQVIRDGLTRMLSSYSDIEVVGEATDGKKAVQLAHETVPDVILMDFKMPNMDGLAATRIIKSELPEIRIIGLSIDDHKTTVDAMLAAGASDFLSKESASKEILAAIRKHGGIK